MTSDSENEDDIPYDESDDDANFIDDEQDTGCLFCTGLKERTGLDAAPASVGPMHSVLMLIQKFCLCLLCALTKKNQVIP